MDAHVKGLDPTTVGDVPWDPSDLKAVVQRRQLAFVISVKDPVSWLWSYFRFQRPKRLRKTGEEPQLTEELVTAWLNTWASRTTSWLRFADLNFDKSVVVQHEQLLRTPDTVLTGIKEKFGLSWSGPEVELFTDRYAKRSGGENRQGFEIFDETLQFDREYHLEGKWMGEVPKAPLAQSYRFMNEFYGRRPRLQRYFDLDHLDGIESYI